MSKSTNSQELLEYAHTILSSCPLILFKISDFETYQVSFVSDNIERYGYDSNEFKDKKVTFDNLVHPEDADAVLKEMNMFAASQNHELYQQYRIKNKNGEYIWVESKTTLNRDKDNRIKEFFIILHDINKNVENGEKLWHSQQLFQFILDKIPQRIFWKDKHFNILGCNELFAKDAGFNSPNEVIGKNDFELSWKNSAQLYRDDDKNVLEKGIEKINFEEPQHRDDGTLIWLRTSKMPLKNKEGDVIGILGCYEDITDRKNSEQTLKLSEAKFKSVFEDSHDCIYVTSPEGEILDMNRAGLDLFGLEDHDLQSLNVSDLYIDEKDRINFQKIISQKGYVKDYNIGLRKLDGEELDCILTSSVRKDSSGNIISYQGIIRDITRQKKAERDLIEAKEKAENADRIKTEFLAQMSHEIRTPINTLLSFSSLIREATVNLKNKELEEYFMYQSRAGNRIVRTIDLLLNMSEIQSGSFQANFRKINIVKTIYDISDNFRSAIKEKSLKIVIENEYDTIFILGDQYSINQIFDNLIDNAVKYTNEGEIRLSILKRNSNVEIIVADTGIGISKNYIDQLFEPFTQEEQGYTRKFEGSGVGLALVKKYCDLNYAEISVKSEKNKGTKFTVTLSLHDSD